MENANANNEADGAPEDIHPVDGAGDAGLNNVDMDAVAEAPVAEAAVAEVVNDAPPALVAAGTGRRRPGTC